jgi:DNA polymerase elongation subunit (family B)
MKILLLDIETAPNTVYTWGFYDQNIATNQIVVSSYILCWAAKWYGDREMMFSSVQRTSPKLMLGRMHKLLDEADVVVSYNGKKFDIPTLNKEFIKQGFKPPAPYKHVDLLQVCRSSFRFGSNKLDFVAKTLELGGKVKHEGFELWIKCMSNDPKAWKKMEKYNRGDVRLLERVYVELRPWIRTHPNHAAYEDIKGCPKCGSESFEQRGYAITSVMKYKRYKCNGCGGWFRGTKSVSVRITERTSNISA